MSTRLTANIPVTFNKGIFNDLYFGISECKDRVILNKGGAGSGKSYAAMQNECIKALETKQKTLIVRKIGTTLKDSVVPLLLDAIIREWGISGDFEYNKTDKELKNTVNGSLFLFRGMDDPEKIKSIQGITRIFIEEMSELEEEDFDQLDLRLRGMDNQQIVGCFNPISEYHWLKSRFFDNVEPNTTIFESTYKDNKFLDQAYKDRLENLVNTNPLYYQIYVKNEWGVEDKSNKFAFAYNEERHSVSTTWDESAYTYFSFDFNVDPISCAVIQFIDGVVRVPEMIKLPNSDIYALCDYIKVNYPNAIPIVTGDATGRNTTALVRDKLNYYIVIKNELRLNDGQLRVPSINPPIVENKVLVNAYLRNREVHIDPVNAQSLHYDLKYVEVDESNKMITKNIKLVKSDRKDKKQQSDALDCFRYYLNMFHRDILNEMKVKA